MYLFLRKKLSLIAIFLLCLLPIWRWLVILPLHFRFLSFSSTMTSLGRIAGLLGMVLFSINLIISARSKILDELFYGLNNLYLIHSKIGAISFSLLLFHPLFLTVMYLQISVRSAALFLLPSQNLAVTFGTIALLLMILLLGITFYVKLKYNHWKISHKFMTAVFVFAVLHVLLITSDISRDNILRFYILILAFIGLACGYYQAFLNQFVGKNFNYIIKNVKLLGERIIEIEAEPLIKSMKFKAGQFVFVSFKSQSVSSEVHPFSLASAPDEKNLKMVIKSLGDFTSGLSRLEAGDLISVEGPYGKFSLDNINNKNQIWLAGGVGITPFLSMARSLKNSDYRIDLYYCTVNLEEAILADELSKISLVNKNFHLMSWCSGNQGFINGKVVAESSGGLQGKDILLCGPDAFMNNLEKQLRELGANKKNIHFEKFKFL